MSSILSETPCLYKWTNICPPLCCLSPTKPSSLEETMMPAYPPCSRAHQITSPSIIRDGKLPPLNIPFDGLPETPTVQWTDPDNALFKYQVPVTPPPTSVTSSTKCRRLESGRYSLQGSGTLAELYRSLGESPRISDSRSLPSGYASPEDIPAESHKDTTSLPSADGRDRPVGPDHHT